VALTLKNKKIKFTAKIDCFENILKLILLFIITVYSSQLYDDYQSRKHDSHQ